VTRSHQEIGGEDETEKQPTRDAQSDWFQAARIVDARAESGLLKRMRPHDDKNQFRRKKSEAVEGAELVERIKRRMLSTLGEADFPGQCVRPRNAGYRCGWFG
jgi:hypothetical protein